jgi:hypothetical protein
MQICENVMKLEMVGKSQPGGTKPAKPIKVLGMNDRMTDIAE